MELEIEKTEVVSANNIQVEVPNEIEILEGKKDYEVSVVKREYTIVGDSIFIPSMYEDAPPWLKEFIDTTIDVAVTRRDQSLIDMMHSILTAMDYVPKNQYTEQINQIVSEDGIINSRIATLNSNLTDAINSTNATIAEINLTYASKEEASAIAINALTASLSADGEIGSALTQLQEAYATLENTTAQSINMLESVMEGEINGNATAMETIRTYVGIDEAGASTGTGLSAYLEASDGTIGGADSQLANTIRVTAEGIESKFAYNSMVNINGVYKKSGFGLSTNYTSGNGTQANPYVSEFWIDASRLKFTNSNQTGQVAPFTIDATGATPQVKFNGVVEFGNVIGTSNLVTTNNIQNAINNNVTTIDGGKITTASILSHQIEANAIAGKNITGGTIRGTQIIGSVIKGSFIDLTTTLALTNWQYFTPSNVPSQYEANFAHHNTGEITVDSEGYVRLPGQQNFMVPSLMQSGTLYNGSLSNVTTTRSVTIDKTWDLYSWDSYNVNTLQRSIRNNTQFSSSSSLVFKGSISCDSNAGNSGTDVINTGTYSLRFLDTDIVVSIQASNGNEHNAEITNVKFNGVTVKSATGRFGESTGSDSAFVNYSTTIKGIPINIKTTFTGMAEYTFIFTATINNSTIITNHTLGDVIRVNSVSHKLNTVNSSAPGQTKVTYEMNFPSTWVV